MARFGTGRHLIRTRKAGGAQPLQKVARGASRLRHNGRFGKLGRPFGLYSCVGEALSLLSLMMKKATIGSAMVVALSCLSASAPCPEGINLLPMYGRVKKCSEQLAADKKLMEDCERMYNSRQLAASAFVGRAWQHYNAGQLELAMQRFNQAWLLDSTNAALPWGFANILGRQGQNEKSLPFFRLAIARNPTEANVWESASSSYANVFFATRNMAPLDTAIICLKQSVRLKPANPSTYALLADSYSYYPQKDSARRYLAIADKLDPKAVEKKTRKRIMNQ
jgi:tetratricopeptide (TPR) repeat protein